jgi:2-polyprenyl-3-methyl-5-hydroxy-6-metoxy-1,4-benzoquinol methylase
MSFFRSLFQAELMSSVFGRTDISFSEKLGTFCRAYCRKVTGVVNRHLLFRRGRKFGQKLAALVENDSKEKVDCPLCGSPGNDRGQDVFHGLELIRCDSCGLHYISPRLSQAGLSSFYSKEYYYEYRVWTGHPVKNEAQEEEIRLSSAKLDKIETLASPESILDIGCSTGEFLEAARARGYRPFGVDVNKFAVEYAREQRGLDVRPGPLTVDTFPGMTFDCITMFEVIEHLPDPVGHFSLLRSLLKPGGIIVLTTPNAGCPQAREDMTNWKHLKPWEHICHYSEETLRQAAGLSGLEMTDFSVKPGSGIGYDGGLIAAFRISDEVA